MHDPDRRATLPITRRPSGPTPAGIGTTWTLRIGSLLVVAAATITACSGGRSADRPPATSSTRIASQDSGVLTGHFYAVGGQSPTLKRPLAGALIITGSGSSTLEVPVEADGAYSVSLKPGIYHLAGRSPAFSRSGGTCPATDDAEIAAGKVTTVNTACHMR